MNQGHRAHWASTHYGKIVQAPRPDDQCYACDAMSVGVAERWSGDKMTLVYACKRHANPAYASKIRVCCFYCGDPTGPRAFTIDGREAHQKCHNEALKQ